MEAFLQRLFSTFANGWPGVGLLILRVATATALLYCVVVQPKVGFSHTFFLSQLIAAGAGMLLLVGLWTPVAGAVVAGIELWVAFTHGGNPWMLLLLVALGASLAMIGPGAWSIDARLFGRKHIEISSR